MILGALVAGDVPADKQMAEDHAGEENIAEEDGGTPAQSRKRWHGDPLERARRDQGSTLDH